MGYIARAPTEHVKATDAGLERSIFIEREDKVKSPTRVVGLGRLRILLIEAKQAEYRPITQDRWVANACALRNVGNLMAAELVPDTVHNGYKANRARIGDLARYVDQAINQDRNDRPGAPPPRHRPRKRTVARRRRAPHPAGDDPKFACPISSLARPVGRPRKHLRY